MLLDYDVALEDDFQQFIKQIPAPVRALLDSADPCLLYTSPSPRD